MIYKKNVSFPYPVLYPESMAYKNGDFEVGIKSFGERNDNFVFNFGKEIGSEFIENLIRENKASLYFILSAGENKFFKIENDESELIIPKNRFNLGKRTQIQLMIKAEEKISFKENNDLLGIYDELKDDIIVEKGAILGFSNILTIDEAEEKGVDLFKMKFDKNLDTDFKIEVKTDNILLIFKDRNYMFKNNIDNMYIYIGLERALRAFIENQSMCEYDDIGAKVEDHGIVVIEDMDIPQNILDKKLYKLMCKKNVEEVHSENIDEVIAQISDRIVSRFVNNVREYIVDEGD